MATHNRFTTSPKFQALAGALSSQGQLAAPKQPARFSRRFYGIGAALKGGRSLASIGSESGAFGVAFEAFSRVGDDLLKQAYDEKKKVAVEAATKQGQAETDQAYEENRMVRLRQEETISAQAFNKSVQTSYLTRLDTNIEGISTFNKAKYPGNPAKFAQAFDEDANKLLGLIPPEWQSTVRTELIKRKGRAINEINVAAIVEEQGRNNSELITGMDRSSAKWLDAIRQSYALNEADPVHAQALADIVENRGKFVGALDGVFGMTAAAKAEAMAKAEKNARFEHVLGAFGEANRAGRGEAFIGAFGKAKLEDDGVAPDERRRLVRTLNAEFTKGREQEILIAAQSIADMVAADFDTEAEALKYVRKNTSGSLESKAVAQVKGRFADKAKAEKANDETNWAALEAAKASGATVAQMSEIMRQGSTRAVRKAMGEFINNTAARQEPETNWGEYDRLMNLTPKDLIEEDIFASRNELSDAEFKAIANRRAGYRDKFAKGKDISEPGTLTQQITAATNEFNWTGGGHAEKRGRFNRRVRAAVNAEQQRTEKELTYDERQKIIERLSKSVFVDDWFGDSKIPAGVISKGNIGSNRVYVPLKEIDGGIQKTITSILKDAGLEPAAKSIEDVAARYRMNGNAGIYGWLEERGVDVEAFAAKRKKR